MDGDKKVAPVPTGIFVIHFWFLSMKTACCFSSKIVSVFFGAKEASFDTYDNSNCQLRMPCNGTDVIYMYIQKVKGRRVRLGGKSFGHIANKRRANTCFWPGKARVSRDGEMVKFWMYAQKLVFFH